MSRILLCAAVLTTSLGLFALLLADAARPATPPPTNVVPMQAKAAPAKVKARHYLGATKADPHLAKMLAEEAAAGAGVIGIIKSGQ